MHFETGGPYPPLGGRGPHCSNQLLEGLSNFWKATFINSTFLILLSFQKILGEREATVLSLCGTRISEEVVIMNVDIGQESTSDVGVKYSLLQSCIDYLGHMGQCSKFIINHRSSYF